MKTFSVEVSGKNPRGTLQVRKFTVQALSEAQARDRALTLARSSGFKEPFVRSVTPTQK